MVSDFFQSTPIVHSVQKLLLCLQALPFSCSAQQGLTCFSFGLAVVKQVHFNELLAKTEEVEQLQQQLKALTGTGGPSEGAAPVHPGAGRQATSSVPHEVPH